jgi:hypothetical protein
MEIAQTSGWLGCEIRTPILDLISVLPARLCGGIDSRYRLTPAAPLLRSPH